MPSAAPCQCLPFERWGRGLCIIHQQWHRLQRREEAEADYGGCQLVSEKMTLKKQQTAGMSHVQRRVFHAEGTASAKALG